MNHAELQRFGMSYAAAWCSQMAASVAAFYEESGPLQINSGLPSIGRSSIAAAEQSFMTAFPNMVVSMVDVRANGDGAVFQWSLTVRIPAGDPNGSARSPKLTGRGQKDTGASRKEQRS